MSNFIHYLLLMAFLLLLPPLLPSLVSVHHVVVAAAAVVIVAGWLMLTQYERERERDNIVVRQLSISCNVTKVVTWLTSQRIKTHVKEVTVKKGISLLFE